MIYVILAILTLWIIILTAEIVIFNRILSIHEQLMYTINKKCNYNHHTAEGHIFCKNIDKDFKCKGAMKK